jgi:hypothetical protein
MRGGMVVVVVVVVVGVVGVVKEALLGMCGLL